MLNLVFIGIQGSGKGTQAKMLNRKLGLRHYAIGQRLRWHVSERTELGRQIESIINKGNFVSDEIADELVFSEIPPTTKGYILDGFPRNKAQAEFLLQHYRIDRVIYFDMDDDSARERLLARRLCSVCGCDYNLISKIPKVKNKCDNCGGELSARGDDYLAAIEKRLAVFHRKTKVLADFFDKLGLLTVIDASQPENEVNKAILKSLD
ncbi:MAG: adenylate kinase [Candidatus Cloacimonadota bacterium]|nr:MAG: adenylate kinase [Candidatus Cloacimonadota bacterium]